MITQSIAYPIEFQLKNLAIVAITILVLGGTGLKNCKWQNYRQIYCLKNKDRRTNL